MIKRKIILSIAILTLLPAFSQNRGADAFSDLISACNGSSVSQIAKPQQSAKGESYTGALDFISGNNGSENILEALSSVKKESGNSRTASEFSVLNVITSAYSGSDFYKAGNWEAAIGNATMYSAYSAGMSYPALNWGTITSGFGYRERFKRMHKGIDIAMKIGDTVRTVLPGVIDRVNYEAKGYGHYVVVKHDDGMETRYAHLSLPLVVPGQRVNTGQPIALSGNTGNSTGPHLHFETRFFGTAVDPRTVFDFNGSSRIALGNYSTYANTVRTSSQNKKGAPITRSTYIVKQGDTLRKIADRAGISVYRLCQLNFMMENQVPEPGTMLRLK